LARSNESSKRKKTGGLKKVVHKKRKRELARPPIETKLGIERKKLVRVRGGNHKIKLYSTNKINVVDKEGKIHNVIIKAVKQNNASVDYNRRSIITKGAILETDLGLVKVTSRPGQDGILNGILL